MVNCSYCSVPMFRMNFYKFRNEADVVKFLKEYHTYGGILYFCSDECIEDFRKSYEIEEAE